MPPVRVQRTQIYVLIQDLQYEVDNIYRKAPKVDRYLTVIPLADKLDQMLGYYCTAFTSKTQEAKDRNFENLILLFYRVEGGFTKLVRNKIITPGHCGQISTTKLLPLIKQIHALMKSSKNYCEET